MIKLPKDINRIINKFTTSGYTAYCAGECVAASYAGSEPQDWDIYTDCPQEEICRFFTDGQKLGARTVRIEFDTDIIADVVTLQGTVEEQLRIYDLTAEAIAENPQKTPVDPYGGRADAQQKLLKPVPGAEELYAKNPVRMLKAVRYVSAYGFDMHKELADLIAKNAGVLMQADKGDILYEYTQIITGEHTGKALSMMADLGLLPGVLGENAVASAGKRAFKEFGILIDNIDKTKRIPLRRMALVAMCFDKHYNDIIRNLPYDEDELDLLINADKYTQDLHFAGKDVLLKQFIYKHGWDKFHFYDKLSKAQVIAFEYDPSKIEGREHIMQLIIGGRQPIFEEDLAIDADDIIEAGITDDRQRAEYLLSLLPAAVHQKPNKNVKKELLSLAKQYNGNKLKARFRGIDWLR